MSSSKKPRPSDPRGGSAVDGETAALLRREISQGGDPLPEPVRTDMEERFGADLGGVRVHQGAAAADLASSLAAEAFTVGSDVFFSQGAYRTGDAAGQHLLAHELTHVVQQDSDRSTGTGLSVGRADDPVEHRADATARRVVAGLAAAPDGAVRRTPADVPAVARMTGGSAHTVRRNGKRHAVNLGPGGRGKRDAVNLGHGPLDFSALGFATDDTALDTAPTTTATTDVAPTTAPADRVEDFLAELAKPGKNTLLHNVPSSGMGRFDAQYLPDVGRLQITVRPRFVFAGTGWSKSGRDKFMADFVKQTQAAWSGQFKFACTKAGFEALVAKVNVVVIPTTDPTEDCHVEMTVHYEGGKVTGIGREQNAGGAARNQGNFNRGDAPVRPHDNLGIRCNLALHDLGRINSFLADRLPRKDKFDRHVITDGPTGMDKAESDALDELVALLAHGGELKATPVPLVVTYHQAKGDKNAKKRAEDIVKILKRQKNNPVRLVAAAAELDRLKKDHATALKLGPDKEKGGITGFRAGGSYDKEATAKEQELEAELGSGAVTIYADEKWATSFQDSDPYSIMAHEFGHMLGNPDEYFGYGPGYMALKKEQLDASGSPADAVAAKNLKLGPISDDSAQIQEDWGKLVKSTGQKLPSMTVKGSGATNSIMNAGAIVAPAHYATLLEALGRITSAVTPGVTQDQWKFA